MTAASHLDKWHIFFTKAKFKAKKQIIEPKKRENVESSAHTPYFPSYEPCGYFIANNPKTNPIQKKQTSKTSVKSLNLLKKCAKIHAKFKNLQTPFKSKNHFVFETKISKI